MSIYRSSLLSMLKPERAFIEDKILELERYIQTVEESLLLHAKRHVYWFGGLFSFLTVILIYSAPLPNLLSPLGLIPILVAYRLAKMPNSNIVTKIGSWSAFNQYRDKINATRNEMGKIYEPAKKYQKQLEVKKVPGCLAIYQDIILSHHFQCMVSLEDRKNYLELSKDGKGRDIPIRPYGQILESLTNFDFDFYLSTQEHIGVDLIKATALSSVVIQCAFHISHHHRMSHDKLSESVLEHFVIIARNALATSKFPTIPFVWTPEQNRLSLLATEVIHSTISNAPTIALKAGEFLRLMKEVEKSESSNTVSKQRTA